MNTAPDPAVILASASPRRAELLDQIGIGHRATSVDVDETPHADEPPADYVQRLALSKARAGCETAGGLPVLGADTTVTVDNEILGKPRDRDDGLAMLARLSARSHTVHSGVAMIGVDEHLVVASSQVTFRTIDADERVAYWATGEPADKAGAYAIQGRGAVFVAELQGSYSAVMGLPLFETAELLARAGVRVL